MAASTANTLNYWTGAGLAAAAQLLYAAALSPYLGTHALRIALS